MNLENFKNYVSMMDWTDVLMSEDINVAYYKFETSIRQILDREAPISCRQMKVKHKSWKNLKQEN